MIKDELKIDDHNKRNITPQCERILKCTINSLLHKNKANKVSSDNPTSSVLANANSSSTDIPQVEPTQNNKSLMKTFLCVFSVFLVMFLAALDQTIVVTIIPQLSRKFDSDKSSWIISGYMLPVSVFSLIWGRLAFIFGTKKCASVSIVIFEIGSLITALSFSDTQLIFGRVIAGVGGSGITTLVYLIINDISTLRFRSWFMNIVTLAFAISSACGPLLGGAFSNNTRLTWRWCFYINLPIGGFALVVLLLTYHPKNKSIAGKRSFHYLFRAIDSVGFAFVAIGVTMTLLGLSFGNEQNIGWSSANFIACIIIGIIFLILFIYYDFFVFKEANDEYPLVPLRMMKLASYSVTSCSIFLFWAELVFIVLCVYLSNNLQYIQGHSPWKAGVYLLPMILSITATSTIVAFLISKTRYLKIFGMVGGILSPISAGLLSLLDSNATSSQQLGLQVLAGISFGLIIQPGMMCAQVSIQHNADRNNNHHKDADLMNVVTSFLAFVRGLGAAIGSTIGSIIFDQVILTSIRLKQDHGVITYSKDKNLSLSEILIIGQHGGEGISETQRNHYISSIVRGYKVTMFCCIGFAAIELISSLFLSGSKIPKQTSNDDNHTHETDSVVADC